tara:strand:+ start:107 stop:484 length:378 start_codon:yes stop_codon:yes gene_type:complete
MATGQTINEFSLKASGNGLSAALDQFIFVVPTTSNRCLPAGAAGRVCGIQQGTAKKNEGVAIAGPGSVSKLRCAGAVSAGQFIKSDTNGLGVRSLGDAPVGALALQDAAANDVISVLVTVFGAAT